jgi:diaminopimelate epimerase
LAAAAAALAAFAADMAQRHGFTLAELSPGGGWGVPMTREDPAAPIEPYVAAVAEALTSTCRLHGLPLPRLVLEPGRSLVARAGVALYRAGPRKSIPGVRTYVSLDGGMADNIRPALYGASYTALIVGDTSGRRRETVTLAGKYCESGDVLIRDVELPQPQPGDLVAVPMSGAYTLSMASNYNLARRPAVVLVDKGRTRLMQRRESYADLVGRDVALERPAAGTGRLRFAKYQALGNDYLVIDPVDFPDPPSASLVRLLCDRHYGIGADGLLWGPTSDREPFALRLFNPDGGEFAVSGNGLRIFARYLWDTGLPSGPEFAIRTSHGAAMAHLLDDAGDRIAFDMGPLSFDSAAIPAAGPRREVVNEAIDVNGRTFAVTAAGIGNPHCVVFLDQVSPELARELGPQIERHPLFPERTNVQLARVLDEHNLQLEIWERGAGYTLASGTSSCAAAGAAVRNGLCSSPVTVHMPGGMLLVEIDPDWSVRLTGDVAPICRGELSPQVVESR